MAELPGKTVIAAEKLAIKNQTQSYPPPQIHDHRTSFILRRSKTELCQRNETGVIFYIGGDIHPFLYILCDTNLSGSEERVIDAFSGVDKSRHADPYAYDLFFGDACAVYMFVEFLDKRIERPGISGKMEFDLFKIGYLTPMHIHYYDPGEELIHRDRNSVHPIRTDRIHLRSPAACRGSITGLHNIIVPDQFTEHFSRQGQTCLDLST